ncbi:MAG: PspC domain-containing protein [Ignavibacteriales bacterium]|nr:PspC domain-containing protein [Ignavibacteriales bacterium]
MPRLRDLKLSTDHKIIAGVCAGIAEWLGWKRITVRIIFIVGSVLPVLPGFVVYIILWMILPKKHL